jgi:phage shock protein A
MHEQILAARSEVVGCVAAEKQLKRRVDELDQEVEKWAARAELAVKGGDDALAREALLQRRRADADRDGAEAQRAEQRGTALELKAALQRMERKLQEFELRKGTLATRAEQVRAGGGVEALGKQGAGPGVFDEFRRMEDRIAHIEDTREAQGELDAVLDKGGPGGLSPAEVEAKFRALEAAAAGQGSVGTAVRSEVDEELSALKKKIRIGN